MIWPGPTDCALTGDFRFIGRSLVAQTSPNNRLLVAKLAKTDDCAADLSQRNPLDGSPRSTPYMTWTGVSTFLRPLRLTQSPSFVLPSCP